LPLRPTIRSIAAAAGVSKSVAQRALAGRAGIAPATRAQVLAVATKLGYRPDPALAKVAAARWRSTEVSSDTTIAWLVGDKPDQRDEWRAVEALTHAVYSEASSLGYRVETFANADYTPSQLARIFRARGIEIVLVGDVNDPAELAEFPWHEFTCVAVGLGTYRPPIPVVMRGIPDSVHEAWHRLSSAGYRRIGCALLLGDSAPHNRLTHSAVLLEQHAQPKGFPRLPVVFLHQDPRTELERYLEDQTPDVLLMPNPNLCEAFENWGFRQRYACALVSMKLFRRTGRWAGFDMNAKAIVNHALRLAHVQSITGLEQHREPTVTLVRNQWWDGRSLLARTVAPTTPL
jgi:LacI family transcriptional regulator